MLEHRLQILLDDARYQRLAREATERHTSIAAVIRDAIDQIDSDLERRRGAMRQFLAADPIDLPLDPEDLQREIDEMHDSALDGLP
jgi:hypothetical protein